MIPSCGVICCGNQVDLWNFPSVRTITVITCLRPMVDPASSAGELDHLWKFKAVIILLFSASRIVQYTRPTRPWVVINLRAVLSLPSFKFCPRNVTDMRKLCRQVPYLDKKHGRIITLNTLRVQDIPYPFVTSRYLNSRS
jgi:hypothetical protein